MSYARYFSVCLLIGTAVACGKKGPPLAPFQRVPAAVTAVTALRVGDDVYLSFTVPKANVDGQEPADIESVEVYGVTAAHPPETKEQREMATLIATVPVRPILPEVPEKDGTPLPLPPGVDRGAVAVVQEALTPETKVAVELPPKKGAIVATPPEDIERPVQILVAPPPTELPRRYYYVIGVSPRGRMATPSTPTSIPLEPASAAPGAPQVTYTESDMTITWEPPAGARSATVEPPPPVSAKPLGPPASGATAVAPLSLPPSSGATAGQSPAAAATAGAGGANSSPGNVTPAAPPLLAPLLAKSLGFNSVATTYNVFEVPTTAAPDALPGASPELKVPLALTPQPLAVTTMLLKGVGLGTERCFYVRPVDTVFGVVVQGPASPITCVTPRDTFPPAAPKQLAAIGSAGVINLIWEPNVEADLAGYIVLRGEAPGEKLQPLTKEPITATIYRDTDLKPGVRYVYAVVAVDKAEPPNVSAQSNRAEETARQ